MERDCGDVRKRVYDYVMESLSVVSETERKLIAGLLASTDCKGLRRLAGYFDWHHWRWIVESKGEDPARIYRHVEEMICGCEEKPLKILLPYVAAFLAGLVVGFLARLILG